MDTASGGKSSVFPVFMKLKLIKATKQSMQAATFRLPSLSDLRVNASPSEPPAIPNRAFHCTLVLHLAGQSLRARRSLYFSSGNTKDNPEAGIRWKLQPRTCRETLVGSISISPFVSRPFISAHERA